MTSTPERLDHFMARANAIYYGTHDPFADFTTSPEISQVFGEIIGLWAAVSWQLLGSPDPVLLVEAGPGRGTLMADALRAVRLAAPGFAGALRVHLIETSARLRVAQATRVPDATWHDGVATVPSAPMVLVANEFLDALPIRQFVRRGNGWTERFVAGGQWAERQADPAEVPAGRAPAEDDIVELNEAARAFVSEVTVRLCRDSGAALLVDYGPARSAAGDSLQALADKRPVNPLAVAGSADLTAHVDFADLAGVAQALGGRVQGPEPQGSFLAALGLFQRVEQLAKKQPDRAAEVTEAARRLVEPAAMGHLFKVLAIASPGCPPLAGFPLIAATKERHMFPALFLSHGSPMLALTDAPARDFLRGLGRELGRPSAVLVASAHWETAMPAFNSVARNTTIHDFYGFPPALFAMRYEPPGAPALAEKAAAMMIAAGLQSTIDRERGVDHGVWVPLSLMYPAADIPVLQVGIQPQLDPAHHVRLGRALAALREEDVLIIGSGSFTHNLARLRRDGTEAPQPPDVVAFADWLDTALTEQRMDDLVQYRDRAPFAVQQHPTDEHLLPLFVALGAGGARPAATRLHTSAMYSSLRMDAYAFR